MDSAKVSSLSMKLEMCGLDNRRLLRVDICTGCMRDVVVYVMCRVLSVLTV